MDFKSNDVAMAERGSGLKHAARIGTGREVPVEVIVNGVSRRTSSTFREPAFKACPTPSVGGCVTIF